MDEFEQFGGYQINPHTNNNSNQDKDEFKQFGGYSVANAPEPTSSPTWTDRAKEVGQGLAYSIGSTADALNKVVAAPVANVAGVAAQNAGKFFNNVGLDTIGNAATNLGNKTRQLSSQYENSNAAETLPQSDFLQTNSDPDKTSNVLKAAGSTAADLLPFSAATKGVKVLTQAGGIATKVPWVAKINRFLETPLTAKNAAIFAGMGAGGEYAKSDDPNVGELEQVAREVGGSMLAGVSVAAGLTKLGRDVAQVYLNPKKYITSPIETYKEGKFIKKYGGKVNEDVVASSEKLDLPLTPELISNNPNAAFLANNKLRSEFVDASYKQLNNNLNEKIIQSLEDNVLNKIGSKIEGSSAESASSIASTKARDVIETNKTAWEAESTKLYDNAKSLATEDQLVKPTNSLNLVDDLISEFSFGSDLSTPKNTTKKILQEFKSTANNQLGMRVRDLIGWKQDLNHFGADAKSYDALLNKVAYTIEEDINSYASSEAVTNQFKNAWKEATDYNRDVIQNIVKTDAVRNILAKEQPVEAIKYMNTKSSVAKVEKMIDNPELMGSLKRTAFEKQLHDRNIITPDMDLKPSTLGRFLKKEQDFAISLIGKDGYKTLTKDFLPYLKQRSLGIKNTSGTSYVTRDSELQRASENLVPYSIWGALLGLGSTQSLKGAVAGGAAGTLPGVKAKLEIRAIKQLSKMASDQKLMKEIIRKGREPKSKSLLHNAINSPATKYQTVNFGAKALPWLGQSPFDKEVKE